MKPTPPAHNQWFTEFVNVAVVFGAAFAGGCLFYVLGLPAPFLLGASVGVFAMAKLLRVLSAWWDRAFGRIEPRLPVRAREAVLLCLSVSIGSLFTAEFLEGFGSLWPSLLVLVGVSVAISAVTTVYLVYFRGYGLLLALMSSLPGGYGEIMLAVRGRLRKDYVVALFHLVRVAAVFGLTPVLLSLVTADAVTVERASLGHILTDATLGNTVGLVVVGGGGYCLGRLLRFPSPYILGPMALSAALHAVSLIQLERSGLFLLVAQLAIGGGIGARIAAVPVRALLPYIVDSAVVLAVALVLVFGAALAAHLVAGVSFMRQFLAYIPGGMYEVTLLALVYGYEMAYVAFHHAARVALMFVCLPLILRVVSPSRNGQARNRGSGGA